MIQVENLSMTYPGASAPAVHNINFSIVKGEIFGFLGPSGAGKTTTQKILYKLLPAYSGKAYIEQVELGQWDIDIYEKIGVCFELPNHYLKLSALENLHFFSSFYKSSYKEPLELLDWVGLKQEANQRVSEFSKGMKMRLNFIRSILHNPDILFLDEPTSGLDPNNAMRIKEIILQLKEEGKTIFITTHLMHDADVLCDRVAFIVNGEIKAMDTPSNLKQVYSKNAVEVKFQGDHNVHLYSLPDLGKNSDFLDKLKKNTIETIHSKEATLEEIFIEVTGKSLQ